MWLLHKDGFRGQSVHAAHFPEERLNYPADILRNPWCILCNCKQGTDTSPLGLLSLNRAGQVPGEPSQSLPWGQSKQDSRFPLPDTSIPSAHLACAAATAAEGARRSRRPKGSLPDGPVGLSPSAAGSKCPQRPARCAAGPGGKEPSVAKGKGHRALASCCFLEAVCASFPGP